jgi:thiol-disulfide isomerase/thioredoxin
VSPERVLIVLALAVLVAAAVFAARAWNARRQKGLVGQPLWRRLGVELDGRPTIVTFSTISCAACHQAQAPAVKAVAERVPVRHVSVDASQQPHIARAFGVVTVPSTAILNRAGQLIRVNHGFAATDKLLGQLHNLV